VHPRQSIREHVHARQGTAVDEVRTRLGFEEVKPEQHRYGRHEIEPRSKPSRTGISYLFRLAREAGYRPEKVAP
jgi:hypothetical protein